MTRALRLLLGLALAISAAVAIGRAVAGARDGLERTVYSTPSFDGEVSSRERARGIDLDFTSKPHGPRRLFSVRWTGFWHVPQSGAYTLSLGADDLATLTIDGDVVLERNIARGERTTSVTRELERGVHAISVEYVQLRGGRFLNVHWAPPGAPLRSFDAAALFTSPPTPAQVRIQTALRHGTRLAFVCWILALAVAGAVGAPRLAQRARSAGGWLRLGQAVALAVFGWRWLAPALALLAVCWGVALRFEALTIRYGPLEQPAWLHEIDAHTRERIAPFRPESFGWSPIETPYVGGDPINYLRFAREMTGFYTAHVREPVFVATTRAWLHALGDQDVAVSFASMTFSSLVLVFTYLLGSAALSPGVGLGATALLAIERDAISWGVNGWRDDAFACLFAAATWALLRCLKRPGRRDGLLAGIIGGGAVLTRITALSFILPGAALIALVHLRSSETRLAGLRAAVLVVAVAALLVAPFVLNCAAKYGDPLYAINYHTQIFRARSGEAYDRPMGVGEYLAGNLSRRPLETLKVFAQGLTTYPFTNKWQGLAFWSPALMFAAKWLALAGLCLFAASAHGRFLLVMLVGSIVPYAFTWHIPGGAEWRFTLHAYPVYLIAAALAAERAARAAAAWMRARSGRTTAVAVRT